MDNKKRHINLTKVDEESQAFFAKGKVSWNKSKADVWQSLEDDIEQIPSGKAISFVPRKKAWLVAASIVIVIGLGGFLGFYSVTTKCPPGTHLVTNLPDGSYVELNAGSFLKFYPNRWLFSRKVFFEGEGYFEVKKGGKFEVISKKAKTVVHGTSFNIYSRENKYNVTCITGKVEIVSGSISAFLGPQMHANIKTDGNIAVVKNYLPDYAISWRNNQFMFTGATLEEVAKEIGRQYGVTIHLQKNFNLNFTGNFKKEINIEKVLDLVCRSLEVNFVKRSDNEYIIIPNN